MADSDSLITSLGSPSRRKHREAPASSNPPGPAPQQPPLQPVRVTPDDLPGERVNVTVHDREQLAKLKKILGVSHFTSVYGQAVQLLIKKKREEGYDL